MFSLINGCHGGAVGSVTASQFRGFLRTPKKMPPGRLSLDVNECVNVCIRGGMSD